MIIVDMDKPKQCGYHTNPYARVLTCPFTRKNGTCRLQPEPKKGEKFPTFKEQYEHCPAKEVKKIGSENCPNHEKLRTMGTDELAKFIAIHPCPPDLQECPEGPPKEPPYPPQEICCTRCWKQWLGRGGDGNGISG